MTPGARARFEANSWEVFIAFLCLLACLTYFVGDGVQERSPTGELLGRWGYLWVAGLFLAAVLILAGLWFGRANVEVAGLVSLVTAVLIQVLALLSVIGLSAVFSAVTFIGLAWAAGARAATIARSGAIGKG